MAAAEGEQTSAQRATAHATKRLRVIVAIAGCVYLFWWFMVELLLPGTFNPLASRLVVVAGSPLLFLASYRSAWVERHLSKLFTAWTCLLVAHYCYLIWGNQGEATWWTGAFVTFAATSMCLQSPREVAAFSAFSMACVSVLAALEGQLGHSIYVPGLGTILLLAYITKRSQAIATVATLRAEQAQDQRLLLAAIVESSGDAIIGTSLDAVIRTWNHAAERLFGYAAAEVVGRPLALLVSADRPGEDAALLARVAKGEQVAPVDTVRKRKDGTDVEVSITVSPIRDSHGALGGVSIAARDISDRKRAEADVRSASAAAEAANRELEAFSYSIAHDLRSPLRAIDGFASVLAEDHAASLDEGGLHHLHRIRDAARRMGLLIDGLLSLGRLTRVGLRTQHVDLSRLARATLAHLQESQPNRAVEVVIHEGLVGTGDSALLGAVLENLLNNAWKFTRDTLRPRIEFGATFEAGRTVYFVRDNGAGFDMAYASKLFGVFQRLHGQNEFEGTGVGLATVQRIVHRHGGTIWAEAKVGEGACFRFTLAEPGPHRAVA
jgi:PAS domain S-box-containing protein